MQGNTAYFFQSLFMGFTILGMFFLASLVYIKVKKIKDIVMSEKAVNIWIFTAIMIILAVMLSAYGFGGIHE